MDIDTKLDIERILDMIEEMVDAGKPVPFSAGRITIDGEQLRDYVSDARAAIPQEMKKSKAVLEERKAIIAGARKEAESIVRRAEDRAKVLVSNDEITQQARRDAAEIISQANTKAKVLKSSAYEYISSLLTESETTLSSALTDVKRTRAALSTKNMNNPR